MKAWEISLLHKLYRTTDIFRPLETLFLSENIDYHQTRNEIVKVFQDTQKSLPQQQILEDQTSVLLISPNNLELFPGSFLDQLKDLETTIKRPIVNEEDNLATIITLCNYITHKDLFEHSFSLIKILDQVKSKDSQLFISEGFEYIDVIVFSALGRCKTWKGILREAKGTIPSLYSWFDWTRTEHKELLVSHTHPSLQSKKDKRVVKRKQLLSNSHPEFLAAVTEGNMPQVEEYLASGVSTECIDPTNFNKTACHIACEQGNIELVKLLVKNGCNLEALDSEEMTPIFYALSKENFELIEYLISLGVNLEHGDCQARTPFYWSCSTCSLTIVEYLFKIGCCVTTVSKMNRSPLSKAAYTGRKEIVDFLLTCPDVDVNEAGERGRTALQMAVWGREGGRQGKKVGHLDAADSPEVARSLLVKGANVLQKDSEGNTALHTAASSFAEASIPVLMEFGAEVNNQNLAGETPMYKASDKGYVEICSVLLEKYKGDPFIKTKSGLDCLEIAIKNQHSKLTKYYLDQLMKRIHQDDAYFDSIVSLIAASYQEQEAVSFLQSLFEHKELSSTVLTPSTLESLVQLKNEEILNLVIGWLKSGPKVHEKRLKIVLNYCFEARWVSGLKSLQNIFQSAIFKLIWSWDEMNLDYDMDDLFYILKSFNVSIFALNKKNETLMHSLVKAKNTKILSYISQLLTAVLQNDQIDSKEILNIYLKDIDVPFIIHYFNTKNNDGQTAFEMAMIHKCYAASTILEQLIDKKLKNLFVIPSYKVIVEEANEMIHKQKEILVSYENKLLTIQPKDLRSNIPFLLDLQEGEINQLQVIHKKATEFQLQNQEGTQNPYIQIISERKVTIVETKEDLIQAAQLLKSASIVGVDMECYSDDSNKATFVCLVQISTINEDFLIDTLKLHPFIYEHLSGLFEAENIVKVFHGCDNDLKWLKSNFDIDVVNLFDTSRAYMLLTNDTVSVGLSMLTAKFLGFELNKAYQKADWRVRPLPKVMVEYARSDSCVLLYLWFVLDREMKLKGEEERSEMEYQIVSRMLRKCWKTLEEGNSTKIRVVLGDSTL